MANPILTFTVNGQQIQSDPVLYVASNTVNYITAVFNCGDGWEDCDTIKSIWSNGQTQIVKILDVNGACLVPHEVLNKIGKIYVNLSGCVTENGELIERITSYPYNAINIDRNAKIDGSETVPVTPSQFDQYVEIVRDAAGQVTGMHAEAVTLPAGSDAIASYSDGLLSLGIPRGERGERGETGAQGEPGVPGERGLPGADGFSPIANVTKVGDTATITITDKYGTTTATISDGSSGSGAVESVNGQTGAVVLTASDVNALPASTQIPSKTSDLQNDSGFLTSAVTTFNGQSGAVTYTAPVTSVNGQTGAVTVTDTTYTLSMSGNVITLTPSSGTATSITLPVYSGGVTA